MRRVVITGGTGLVGRALIDEIKELFDVYAISRNPARDYIPGASLAGYDEFDRLVDGSYGVINLAGANIGKRWTPAYKREIRESRLAAGHMVVSAIRDAKKKPNVLIQASAVGAYGDQGETMLTEDAPYADDFLATLCKDWEESTKPVEKMGVRRVIIRSGHVLDAKKGMLAEMVKHYRFGLGGPIASGEQYWPWIHARDEARAIHYLLDHKKHGVYNLVANATPNAEFNGALARVLKRPAFFRKPASLLRLVLGEFSRELTTSQRVAGKKLRDEGFKFSHERLEDALRDLLNR